MLKRFLIVCICVSFGLFITSITVAQDKVEPAKEAPKVEEKKADEKKADVKEEKKAEDLAGDEKLETVDNPKDEAKKGNTVTLQAKTFFDGVSTYANSKVHFKLNTTDNMMLDKTEYKVNGTDTVTYEKPFTLDDEGKYTITYFGTDKLGNREDEKMFRVIIDNTAPEVVFTTNKPVIKIGDKYFGSKTMAFTVNAKDAASGVSRTDYSINGKDYTEYVTSFSISTDGDVELKAKSVDNVANLTENFTLKLIDDTGKEVEIKDGMVKIFMDNVPPTIELKSDKEFVQKDGKNIASTEFKYSVAATDNESGVATILVRVDGKGDFEAYKGDITFATNGEHLIEAKALDKMGNVSNTAILSVFVDVLAPQTTIETVTE
jgi:hypothetical protein